MKTPLAIAAITAALCLGPAGAQAASPLPPNSEEGQIRAIETGVLGPEHAAEHAQERADIRRRLHRWRAMPASRRAR